MVKEKCIHKMDIVVRNVKIIPLLFKKTQFVHNLIVHKINIPLKKEFVKIALKNYIQTLMIEIDHVLKQFVMVIEKYFHQMD